MLILALSCYNVVGMHLMLCIKEKYTIIIVHTELYYMQIKSKPFATA